MISRLAILILTLLGLAMPAAAQTAPDSTAVTPEERFASSAAITRSSSAVLITDLRTGETLADLNSSVPLLPASIMKTVTIASLLNETGTDWRYKTPVYVTGPVRDGVLSGNLLIVGSGDPSINSKCEPQSADFVAQTAEAVKRHGIEHIKGTVVVDGSIYKEAYPPSWHAGDKPHSYGAGQYGLNFENNSQGKAAVADPQGKFVRRLREALAAIGIKVDSVASKNSRRDLLFTHESPDIEEIMRSCMMRSDNLFAECMLRTYAHLNNLAASPGEGGALEMKEWKRRGADTGGVKIVDGSGLSRSNRVTARFVTDVLRDMADNPYYASFFPLAGQEGTLRNFMKGSRLDSYAALKTGSMNGIQCYAGYLLDDDYVPTHTIVIIINNFRQSRSEARKAAADMLLEIFPENGKR